MDNEMKKTIVAITGNHIQTKSMTEL